MPVATAPSGAFATFDVLTLGLFNERHSMRLSKLEIIDIF
jgi:hypothetical protein